MKLIVIAACCLFASLISVSRAATLPLKAGESFTYARSKLQAAGWKMDPAAHSEAGEYFGVDRRLIERGFAEVDSCSLGKTFCIFQYTQGQSCLRLQTEGEQIAAMRVVGWSRDCPDRAVAESPIMLPAEVRFLRQRRDECERFGDCNRIDTYSKKVEKKYARNHEVMEFLQIEARRNRDARK